jgi:SlyX protein
MSQDLEDRVMHLEMTVTHQEQTIHQLSDVITEQWAQIEKLRRELSRLDEIKADIEPEEEASQRPPHY